MRVVLPAPETPMRQVRMPGRKAPLMPRSSSSWLLPATSLTLGSPLPCISCITKMCKGSSPDEDTVVAKQKPKTCYIALRMRSREQDREGIQLPCLDKLCSKWGLQ